MTSFFTRGALCADRYPLSLSHVATISPMLRVSSYRSTSLLPDARLLSTILGISGAASRAAPNGPDSICSLSSGLVLTQMPDIRPHTCERRPNPVEFRRVLFTWCLSDDSNRLHQRSTFLPCRRLLGLLFEASTPIELNLNPLMIQGIWRRRGEASLDFTLASSVPAVWEER